MSDFLHTLGIKILAGISGILLLFSGATHTATNTQPSVQTAAAVVATQEVAPTSGATTSTDSTGSVQASSGQATIVNQYITQPVIERTVVQSAPNGYVTQAAFQSAIDALTDKFGKIIYGTTYPAPATTYGSGGVFNSIALSNKIDNLSGVTISNSTIDTASIPDLSGSYLSISGGNASISGFYNTSGTTGGYKVDGNLILQASSTNGLTAVGQNALANYFDTTSTGGETAVGYQALQNATSSKYDVAVGYQALKSSDTVNSLGYNTAIGYQSMINNASGAYNTAVGFNALYTNTDGNYNSAVGHGALFANTTGQYNVGLGYSALSFNTTGSSNAAIGNQALLSNTTGGLNSALGRQALYWNASATNTVAVGYRSSFGSGGTYSNQGGTTVGYQSGYSVSTGSDYNTLVGYQSGYSITTGARNTLLGPSTITASKNQVTTGSNNIAIGNDVAIASSTLSNQLNIGNFIYGTGLSSTGATVSDALIGFGTTTPWARLSIAGKAGGTATLFVISTSTSGYATSTAFIVDKNGLVGIGTTTPWRTLSVNGTVGFAGLTSDTADAKVLCLTATNEVVANAGTSCITSSQRFKNTIEPLATSSGLAEVLQLNPVSFQYNSDIGIPGEQVGFIAEQVQQVDPRLVVLDASSTPFTVRYEQLTSILAKAIQEIGTISGAFKDALVAWLGDAANGIHDLYATIIHSHQVIADQLCAKKADGTIVCVDGDQLAAAVSGQVSAGGSASGASNSAQAAATAPPIVEVIGNNPATVNVGDTYSDLGAKITGPTADLNLGIHTFVGTTPIEFAAIDTSAPATYHLYYVATDQNGLTATSTRTVIVQAATSTTTDTASTTTDASTTSQ